MRPLDTPTPPSSPTPPTLPRLQTRLLIVVAVLGLATIGLFAYQNFSLKKQLVFLKSTSPSQLAPQISPSPTPDPTVGWKTYTNPSYPGLTFQYDDSWSLSVSEEDNKAYIGAKNTTILLKRSGTTLSYSMKASHAFGWGKICYQEGSGVDLANNWKRIKGLDDSHFVYTVSGNFEENSDCSAHANESAMGIKTNFDLPVEWGGKPGDKLYAVFNVRLELASVKETVAMNDTDAIVESTKYTQ